MSSSLHPYADLYANPKGPGDARPTGMQIIKDNDLTNKLVGKVMLITGATSGIGVETARALHATGADIYMTTRTLAEAESVIEDILKTSEGKGTLEAIEMDLGSFEAVKRGVKEFLSKSDTLNSLVNNAGVLGSAPGSQTADGFNPCFGINHLAHYLLASLLIPTLLSSSTASFKSRLVVVASNSHRISSIRWDDYNVTQTDDEMVAYGQSKTGNIWTANYIDRVYGSRGLRATAVHPGIIETGLLHSISGDTKDGWMADPANTIGFQSIPQGSAAAVWAAVAPAWEDQGGKYLYGCSVAAPAVDTMSLIDPGYGPHCYDVEGEDRLWKLSAQLTGFEAEQ